MSGIAFEGADASGKSTLARKVAGLSGRGLFLAGGKPRDEAHMCEMIVEQNDALNAGKLVDRISCVSQQIYREGLYFRGDLMDEVHRLLAEGHVLVYCRTPDHILHDPRYHEWKDYDTEEWKQNVLSNQGTFVARYDALMGRLPCVIYDWTSEESRHIEELLGATDVAGVSQALREIVRMPA